jgi:hypothetical protein
MFYIVFALLLFISSVIIHISFCRRTNKPGLHARVYIIIAVIFIALYSTGVYAVGQGNFLDPHSFWGLPFKITAGVIFVLLAPLYVTFYTLTQMMSPSKKILLTVSHQGNPSFADIELSLQEEDFIGTRLSDLSLSGCIRQTKGRYTLSPSGQKIAMVLNIMQRILGRGIGG